MPTKPTADPVPDIADAPAPVLNAQSPIVVAAKQSALTLLEDAHAATVKLLSIAAGDEKTLLTGAEAAAIPIILDTIPPHFRSIVAPFVQAAASKVEGPLNASIDGLVSTGLGLAHNWLEGVIATTRNVLER